MKLTGIIEAADSTAKTITIKCDGSISGVPLAGKVVLIVDTGESDESVFLSKLDPNRFERNETGE